MTTKTFRGRTLDEVLPQVRAELGDDAIVLRCREGLSGGVMGFFRRACVEVEAAARPAHGALAALGAEPVPTANDAAALLAPAYDVPALEVRTDRATASGLASPGVQLLVEQAAPFADQLRSAQRDPFLADDPTAAGVASLAIDGLTDLRLYGPQPAVAPTPPDPPTLNGGSPPPFVADPTFSGTEAPAPAADEPAPVPEAPAPESPVLAADVVVPAPAVPVTAPAAARAAERQLVAAGLDTALAVDIVGEALVHGLPFGTPRGLKRLVRTVIAQRLRTLGHRGAGTVTLAVTGPEGAHGSTVVAQLAAAYARAGGEPVVVALRSDDDGEELQRTLTPFGLRVELATDGAAARRIAQRAAGAMVLVDLPTVALRGGAGDGELARDLAALGADEVHLALPATTSAAAADELAALLHPLGLTHVALTRMDDTQRAGAGLGFCLASGRALSYLSARDGITPACAASVAQLLVP